MPECPYLVLLWAIARLSKRALLGCVVPGGECVIHHCCQLFVKMVDLSLPSAACSLASHARQLSITERMLTWGCCTNFPVLESEYIICCQTDISKLCQNLLANFLRYLTLTFKQSDSFDFYEKENYDLPNLCLDHCFSPWRHFDGANQMLSFCTCKPWKAGWDQGMNCELLSNFTLCHTSLFVVLQMNRWGAAKSEGARYPNLAPWCHSCPLLLSVL